MKPLFEKVRCSIRSEKIPPEFYGVRMVHLSDLHGAWFGKNHSLLIKAIDDFHPDMVLMTGDMADSKRGGLESSLALCRRLARRYPVYYSIGNHEMTLEPGCRNIFFRQLKQWGICVLDNEWQTITRDGGQIRICGLTMPLVYYKDPLGEFQWGIQFEKEDMERFLGKADLECCTLLLAHNPLYYPAYREWGADLTLSGHVHGGIIRFPGKKLPGLLSPDLRLFPPYSRGHYIEQGKHLVVSSGLGNRFLKRICNPPQLVELVLEGRSPRKKETGRENLKKLPETAKNR